MAEKEERIIIKKQINYHPPYGGWRGDGKEIVLTRQEAVERMAKEMARLYCPKKPTKKEFESIWEYELLLSTQKYFKELAEAALDSLLEETK